MLRLKLTHFSQRAQFQYPIRRLIIRSQETSKLQNLYLGLSDHSKILQAPRQNCCRRACQISKRYDNLNFQFRCFDTSRDLTTRVSLIGYWNGSQVFVVPSTFMSHFISLCWWNQSSELMFQFWFVITFITGSTLVDKIKGSIEMSIKR